MEDFDRLSNEEIFKKLKEYNLPVVPVNDSTRNVLISRLKKHKPSVASATQQKADPRKSPTRSPGRSRKRPQTPEPELQETLPIDYTDADITQSFKELGWEEPKITVKNRDILIKKIKHARARSRSESRKQIFTSTVREEENGDSEHSMDVDDEVDTSPVDIPVRRTARAREKRVSHVPSFPPKKLKRVENTIAINRYFDEQMHEPSHSSETEATTAVISPPSQPTIIPHSPPALDTQQSALTSGYSRTSQPFLPSQAHIRSFDKQNLAPTSAKAANVSPDTSPIISGQGIFDTQPFSTERSSSLFSSRSGANDVSANAKGASSGMSRLEKPTYSYSDREMPASHSRPSSQYPLHQYNRGTYTSSTSSSQTNIDGERSAFVADLKARLFGANNQPIVTPPERPSIPFSKQTPTFYNIPTQAEKLAERKTAHSSTPLVAPMATPSRRFYEEQSSDHVTPPTKLNNTFNSPAIYRLSTPARARFSAYLPSFLQSKQQIPSSIGQRKEGSSSEDEDEEPAPKRIAVSKVIEKAKSSDIPSNLEMTAGVLWAKYLPHICIGFFSFLLYLYWQLRNAKGQLETEDGEINVLVTIAVGVFWNVFLIVLIGLGVYLALKGRNYYVARKRKEEEEVIDMVKRVIQRLTEHAEACKKDNQPDIAFLPKTHLRDELIPVEEKEKRKNLWKKVERFIEGNESRIRKELREIQGEMYEVWRWLPSIHSSSDNRDKGWQGSAFNVDEAAVNHPPVKSPTPCLKIRHMFDPDVEDESQDWQRRVANDLLKKCSDAKIVHMAVDPASKDGVVYVKCATKEDAKKVYTAVHAWWYGGKIVVVRYVTLQRYHERFPTAASAKEVVKPI
ncbi:muscle M-line assembly protein unc-89-like [Artemia franciscana]|uniref:LEM domain-containing protein n=1 Tax=Artemia franciscana TaxID=6661 RepID=A0AA88IHB5_ARTSF|nr:hypothetical protein QYM36_007641 [Artemia franciscana]KAK2726861.1 hypothetical protein QYM36_007641 [Artemia franciscana]KAK2726862.1 hypothetical protein QYM36_007641 [Artemia franciscana]